MEPDLISEAALAHGSKAGGPGSSSGTQEPTMLMEASKEGAEVLQKMELGVKGTIEAGDLASKATSAAQKGQAIEVTESAAKAVQRAEHTAHGHHPRVIKEIQPGSESFMEQAIAVEEPSPVPKGSLAISKETKTARNSNTGGLTKGSAPDTGKKPHVALDEIHLVSCSKEAASKLQKSKDEVVRRLAASAMRELDKKRTLLVDDTQAHIIEEAEKQVEKPLSEKRKVTPEVVSALQSEERRKGKDGTMKGGWISTLQKAAATRREVYLVPKIAAKVDEKFRDIEEHLHREP